MDDVALDLGVAELAFGLTLELRLQHLDADNRGQAFAHVLAGEVRVLLLEDSRLARVTIEHVGQRGTETGQVAATSMVWIVLANAQDVFDEGVVVLESDLDLRALDLAVDVERVRVDRPACRG